MAFFIGYHCGSKGPILAFGLTVLFFYFKTLSYFKITIGFVFFSLLLFLVVSYTDVNIDDNSYFVQRFLRIVPDNSSESVIEHSRGNLYKEAITFIDQNDNVFLLGVGPGNYGKLRFGLSFDLRYYPHNIFLELTYRARCFCIFCFSYSSIFVNNKVLIFFSYISLYYLINASVTGDIILNEMLFFYMGMALTTEKKTTEYILSNDNKDKGSNSILII